MMPYNGRSVTAMGRDTPSRPARAISDAVDPAFPKVASSTVIDADQFRSRRQARRLANATRQAAMVATPSELVHLRRVVDAVASGVMSVDDARSVVAELRRVQQRRAA